MNAVLQCRFICDLYEYVSDVDERSFSVWVGEGGDVYVSIEGWLFNATKCAVGEERVNPRLASLALHKYALHALKHYGKLIGTAYVFPLEQMDGVPVFIAKVPTPQASIYIVERSTTARDGVGWVLKRGEFREVPLARIEMSVGVPTVIALVPERYGEIVEPLNEVVLDASIAGPDVKQEYIDVVKRAGLYDDWFNAEVVPWVRLETDLDEFDDEIVVKEVGGKKLLYVKPVVVNNELRRVVTRLLVELDYPMPLTGVEKLVGCSITRWLRYLVSVEGYRLARYKDRVYLVP